MRRPSRLVPVVLGCAAAAWAVVISLLVPVAVMVVAWMTAAADALRWQEALGIAATIWSVAQSTPVVVDGVTYSLSPWGLTIVSVLLVAYSGRWALRRAGAGRAFVAVSAGVVATYAASAAVIASIAGPGAVTIPILPAVVHAVVVAVLAMMLALWREGHVPVDRIPGPARAVVRAGVAATAVILGAAAIVTAAVLALRIDDAAAMLTDLRAGTIGGFVLVIIAIAYVPIVVVWAASYLLGAGVVLGPAVVASPFVAVMPATQLPPFPLFAVVPTTASPLAWALPIVGVLAGSIGGAVIARQAGDESRMMRAAAGLGAGVVGGVLLAVLAAISQGSLGNLRLAHIGPAPLAVGVLAAILIGIGALPTAVLRGPRSRPGLAVATDAASVSASSPATADAPPSVDSYA